MDDTKSPEPAGQDELEMKDLRYDDPAQDVESSRQPTLKKSVERRWMVAIYGLMFLAGQLQFFQSSSLPIQLQSRAYQSGFIPNHRLERRNDRSSPPSYSR
jgi:hypothetical protein